MLPVVEVNNHQHSLQYETDHIHVVVKVKSVQVNSKQTELSTKVISTKRNKF